MRLSDRFKELLYELKYTSLFIESTFKTNASLLLRKSYSLGVVIDLAPQVLNPNVSVILVRPSSIILISLLAVSIKYRALLEFLIAHLLDAPILVDKYLTPSIFIDCDISIGTPSETGICTLELYKA